jgi:hypothetical protein
MDAGMLANAIMQALTPLLGGVGAALATDIGNTIYDKSKEQARRLLEAIRHRFSKEQDEGSATLALQTFVNGDPDFAGVVRTKLERILQNDPDFSTEVLRIMRSGPLQSSSSVRKQKRVTSTFPTARAQAPSISRQVKNPKSKG